MCDNYKLTNHINSLIYEIVRKNFKLNTIKLTMDFFVNNIRDTFNCSLDPAIVIKLVDNYNDTKKQPTLILYYEKPVTELTEEQIITDLINRYGLSLKPLYEFYKISSDVKKSYPYHGLKIKNKCPDKYALDVDTNSCLSTDIIPLGTFINYNGNLLTGSGRNLLLLFKKQEGNWESVKKIFESPLQKESLQQHTEHKKLESFSYPVLSDVFSFDNITFFTKNWPVGLSYIPDFMKKEYQNILFDKINSLNWNQPEVLALSKKLDRDIIQYGYIYDFNIKDIKGHPLIKANKPPEFINCIVNLIWNNFNNTKQNHEPNQIIITKLKPGQGLGPLIDHPMFENISITLSLGSVVIFNLIKQKEKIEFPLIPGSLLILDENAKLFSQEIQPRKTDNYTMNFINPKNITWERTDRISITIRSLKKEYRGIDNT